MSTLAVPSDDMRPLALLRPHWRLGARRVSRLVSRCVRSGGAAARAAGDRPRLRGVADGDGARRHGAERRAHRRQSRLGVARRSLRAQAHLHAGRRLVRRLFRPVGAGVELRGARRHPVLLRHRLRRRVDGVGRAPDGDGAAAGARARLLLDDGGLRMRLLRRRRHAGAAPARLRLARAVHRRRAAGAARDLHPHRHRREPGLAAHAGGGREQTGGATAALPHGWRGLAGLPVHGRAAVPDGVRLQFLPDAAQDRSRVFAERRVRGRRRLFDRLRRRQAAVRLGARAGSASGRSSSPASPW